MWAFAPQKKLGPHKDRGKLWPGWELNPRHYILSLYSFLIQVLIQRNPSLYLHIHCRATNIFISHNLLPSDLVAQSVEQRWSNPKVVISIPTLVRVFLCPCVGPIPSVGLTLTWSMGWNTRTLHYILSLYSFLIQVLHGHTLLIQRNPSLYL